MYKLRREQLSQVFLHSPELVNRLVGKSSIGQKDIVIEIGPGKFDRWDFIPKPQVETVMLRFYIRTNPLLPESEKPRFQKFVANIFGGGRRMRQNLRREFNQSQINHLARKLKLNLNSKPSDLALVQWLCLYQFKQNFLDRHKLRVIPSELSDG